jgi:hypothetical protein
VGVSGRCDARSGQVPQSHRTPTIAFLVIPYLNVLCGVVLAACRTSFHIAGTADDGRQYLAGHCAGVYLIFS